MEGKYEQVYPERAVKAARATLEAISQGMEVDSERADAAIDALDSLGFPPDEPLFLLRGQDELAPDTVRAYIRLVETEEGAFGGDRLGTVNRLYELVTRMQQWEPRKLPD